MEKSEIISKLKKLRAKCSESDTFLTGLFGWNLNHRTDAESLDKWIKFYEEGREGELFRENVLKMANQLWEYHIKREKQRLTI